jgi:mRNA-degrading endonuclease RelE of RelBE toxin-antitoxin system
LRIEWSETAQETARRFMRDQAGMRAVSAAVAALADPAPPEAFVRGEYCRLRAGDYRVRYRVRGDLITIVRVDRVI